MINHDILYQTTSFSLHLISPNEQTCLHSPAASIGEDSHSAKTGPGSAPGLCTPSLLHPSTLHPSTSHYLTKWVNESKCYSEGATENQATESKGKKGREGGKLQKLLTHKDDNVYMYITVLVLFPGPSTLPIWRLGTGLMYNYMHM